MYVPWFFRGADDEVKSFGAVLKPLTNLQSRLPFD
jgi:hypothetical protein